MTGIDTRPLDQRRAALDRANEVRSRRAAAHREIARMTPAEASVRLAALIRECPEWLSSASVRGLMLWLPRVGPARAGALPSRAGVTPYMRTLRQVPFGVREQLAQVIERRARELAGNGAGEGRVGNGS